MARNSINDAVDSITSNTVINEENEVNREPSIDRPSDNTPGNLSPLSNDEFDNLFKKSSAGAVEVVPQTKIQAPEVDIEEGLQQPEETSEAEEIVQEETTVKKEAKETSKKYVKASNDKNPFEDLEKSQVVEKVEEKKVEEVIPVEQEVVKAQEEVKKAEEALDAIDQLELPPASSLKSKEAFETVKADRKAARLALKEAQAKAAELEEKLKSMETSPTLPKEIEEELQIRRLEQRAINANNDPEIKKNYDAKIESNENLIIRHLKDDHGLSEENIQKIKELGGIEKINLDKIIESIPKASQNFIEKLRADNMALRIERKDAVEKLQSEAKDTILKQKESIQALESEKSSRIKARKDALIADADFLKPREIPKTADEQTRKSLEEYNNNIEKLKKDFDDYSTYSNKEPEQIADIAAKAVLAGALYNQVQNLTTENEALKAKLESIKKAGQTAPKRTNPNGTPPPVEAKVSYKQDAAAAMDSHFKNANS